MCGVGIFTSVVEVSTNASTQCRRFRMAALQKLFKQVAVGDLLMTQKCSTWRASDICPALLCGAGHCQTI
jgi:hypothetical protein